MVKFGLTPLLPYEIKELQQKGLTRKQIAFAYYVNERTVYRWNKRIHKPKQKQGRKLKLIWNKEILKTFLDYTLKNNTKTQLEMADYASQLTGQPVSRFIISRLLKKHEITRKKLAYHYLEQSEEKVKEFKVRNKHLLSLPILALDECSFHLGEAPRYGYSNRGSRANSRRTGKKSANYTLLLCIRNVEKKGVVIYQLIEGGVKAENFHYFLSNLKLSSQKNYLLMDNVRIHHANQACKKLGLTTIKELLVSKNIEPVYLPAYTPELNPTELCFNFIRQQVEKNKPQTVEELKEATKKVMSMLHEQDLTKYFWHCFNYVRVKWWKS